MMDYLQRIRNSVELMQQIDRLGDFRICEDVSEIDLAAYFGGYSKEKFRVFGKDASGSLFGFIGDGDIASLPIGYASGDWTAGKIANNISDFFHLITLYPFWRDLCSANRICDKNRIAELEKEEKGFVENYSQLQNFIIEQLGLNRSSDILGRFHSTLTSEPKFVLYAVDDDSPCDDLWKG